MEVFAEVDMGPILVRDTDGNPPCPHRVLRERRSWPGCPAVFALREVTGRADTTSAVCGLLVVWVRQ
ncbi:hypothetical protein GCM10009700_09580 [Brevibacterium sanguinis]